MPKLQKANTQMAVLFACNGGIGHGASLPRCLDAGCLPITLLFRHQSPKVKG